MSVAVFYILIGAGLLWFLSWLAESKFTAFVVIAICAYMGWLDDAREGIRTALDYPHEISDRLNSTGHFLESTRK